jgi:hypothetical protein
LTLLSHYWRDDDPVELTSAIGQDWADVLEGLPREMIQRACIQYQREYPRKKPTPGAIYEKARSYMPRPAPVSIDQFSPVRDPDEIVTSEAAARIMAEAGFSPKRFGGN